MGSNNSQPFSALGQALRRHRQLKNQSRAEVSGAVEIAAEHLELYEQGKSRPPADVLFLLISHFNLEGDDANELWRLSGYDAEARRFVAENPDAQPSTKTFAISAQDARIVYTDLVQIMINDYGVVMNFLQAAGTSNRPLAISRIGMSREHAQSVLELLKKTLEEADAVHEKTPKQLPDSTQK